jgi:hypothetical protein
VRRNPRRMIDGWRHRKSCAIFSRCRRSDPIGIGSERGEQASACSDEQGVQRYPQSRWPIAHPPWRNTAVAQRLKGTSRTDAARLHGRRMRAAADFVTCISRHWFEDSFFLSVRKVNCSVVDTALANIAKCTLNSGNFAEKLETSQKSKIATSGCGGSGNHPPQSTASLMRASDSVIS